MADVNTTSEQQTDPYVHEAGSARDKELNNTRPYVSDWERVIDKIKANAAQNGGYYIAKDQKTKEPFLDPSTGKPYVVNALLTKIHDTQVAGKGFDVPGAGLKREGNHFYFKGGKEYAIPAPQPEVKEAPKTEVKQETKTGDDNDKDKGFFARNKGLLIGLGAVLAGGAAAFFLARRHNKKKRSGATAAISAETPAAAVTPTPAPTPTPTPAPTPQIEASSIATMPNLSQTLVKFATPVTDVGQTQNINHASRGRS